MVWEHCMWVFGKKDLRVVGDELQGLGGLGESLGGSGGRTRHLPSHRFGHRPFSPAVVSFPPIRSL
jgi:hypothetical protein